MIYVFLADGFEETEAITPIDILKRAGFEVITVGVQQKIINGAHKIGFVADLTTNELTKDKLEAVILPGGMPGTLNLEKDKTVNEILEFAFNNKKIVGAICAAPSILGHKGMLKNKKATCFDGFEKDLIGATYLNQKSVIDENIVTACGAGAASDFGFSLLSALGKDEQFITNLKKQMKYI